jgi:hypothetical protein
MVLVRHSCEASRRQRDGAGEALTNTSYREAIEAAFGSDVDYAQLLKDYGVQGSEDGSPTERRYSPNVVKSIEKRVVSGNPDPDHISTSPRTSHRPTGVGSGFRPHQRHSGLSAETVSVSQRD